MNTILLISLLFTLNLAPPKEVNFIKATSQKWVGGTLNPSTGMNYRIVVQVKKNFRRLKFQKLWIDNQEFNFSVLKHQDTSSAPRYKRNDTVYVVAGYFDKIPNIDQNYSDVVKNIETKPESLPKGDAVIEYKIGKRKKRYLVIDRFEKLDNRILP